MDIEKEILQLKVRVKALEELLKIDHSNNQGNLQQKRDKTKYMFESKVYPKNRLVLAVIKKYVSDNDPTFLELQNTFDKSLQGTLNVVDTLENVSKIKDASKRYFTKNVILLKDGTRAVVCTQWGIFNIPKFEQQAKSLGYDIQKIVLPSLIE